MNYSKIIKDNLNNIVHEVKENGFIPMNMGYYIGKNDNEKVLKNYNPQKVFVRERRLQENNRTTLSDDKKIGQNVRTLPESVHGVKKKRVNHAGFKTGSLDPMGSPEGDLTPPLKIDFSSKNYKSLQILKSGSDDSTLTVAFDSEWVNCEPRYVLSWQFACFYNDFCYEFIFLNTDNERLYLEDALSFILDYLDFKKYNYKRNCFYKICVGFNGLGDPEYEYINVSNWSYVDVATRAHPFFLNGDDVYQPIKHTINEAYSLGLLDKYMKYKDRRELPKDKKWIWARRVFRLPKGDKRLKINLVCHFGRVDLSTVLNYSNRNILSFCSEVQGGLVTLERPVTYEVVSRSRNCVNNKSVFPISVTVRDTMAQAPANKKKLADLGKSVGLDKLYIGANISDMLNLLVKDPKLFFDYSSRDSVVTLAYISKIYGVNSNIKVSITGAGANVMCESIKETLGCKDLEEYNRIYRGLEKMSKGKIANPLSPGFLEVSNMEPISLEAREVQSYASEAYHGGFNGSFYIGAIKEATFDFDLKNAYPTAMSLLEDIDWERPIRSEIVRRELSLSDWRVFGDSFYPIFPMVAYITFEFPKDVKFPCIPVSADGNLVFPRTSDGVDGVFASGPEIYLALKMGAKVFCKRGYFLNTRGTKSLAVAVKDLVNDRALAKDFEGKGSLNELLLKTMVCSGYGKIAQNVVNKSTWNAYTDEMQNIGASVITNPVHATMTTSLVRCVVISALEELHRAGFVGYSCTTDGFISDAPEEVLNSLDLFGFSYFFKQSRVFLSGSDTIWEAKHTMPNGFFNFSTRANMALNLDGVSAHNSTKTPYPKDSYEDRLTFIIRGLTRNGRVEYEQEVSTGFKELVRGANYSSKVVKRRVTMDFDLKRKPLKESFTTVKPVIEDKEYEIMNFDSVPYDTIEEFRYYRSKKDLVDCLRTAQDWSLYSLKLKAGKTGKKIRKKDGLGWAKLMSCVMGCRKGLWTIDELVSTDNTVQEKCDWINSLSLSKKQFKISDRKNCRRKDRQANMMLKEDIEDYLSIMKAHSFKV